MILLSLVMYLKKEGINRILDNLNAKMESYPITVFISGVIGHLSHDIMLELKGRG